MWAATFRGLAKFNPRDGTFTSYDSRSGLPTDTVLGILEDENGYLWVSTQDGLSRFDPRTQTCTNYHTSDGLLTDLFSEPVVATRSPSGEMFFGSHSGLVAFFPDQVIEQKFVAPVVLTDFRLFGEPVQPGKEPLKAAHLVRHFARVRGAQHLFIRLLGLELRRSSADSVPTTGSKGSNRNGTRRTALVVR